MLPEVFGFVAQTLSQKGIILEYYFLFWDKVWATKPKTSGNEPIGIGNDDLGCFPNFPPKDDGQRYRALRFRLRDCAHNLRKSFLPFVVSYLCLFKALFTTTDIIEKLTKSQNNTTYFG